MGDVERARGVGLEESLQDLSGLSPAGVALLRRYTYLKVVVEPCREAVRVSFDHVLAYRGENIIPLRLGLNLRAEQDRQDHCRYFGDYSHGASVLQISSHVFIFAIR